MSINVATLNIIESTLKGNFAKRNTNGFEMISSSVTISDSTIDNSVNKHKLPIEYTKSIETGFINLNYGSILEIVNTHVNSISGMNSAFIYSVGLSSLNIGQGTIIQNCVGGENASILVSLNKYLNIRGLSLKNSSGLLIE